MEGNVIYLFPNVIWLGIALMLMWMMQFLIHGIMIGKLASFIKSDCEKRIRRRII